MKCSYVEARNFSIALVVRNVRCVFVVFLLLHRITSGRIKLLTIYLLPEVIIYLKRARCRLKPPGHKLSQLESYSKKSRRSQNVI